MPTLHPRNMPTSQREDTVRAHFRRQAESCRRLGSPFTADLLDLAAERLTAATPSVRAVLDWPGDPAADALALRFAGWLHALALSGAAPDLQAVYRDVREGPAPDAEPLWRVVAGAIDSHGDGIERFIERPPQTNEVARSAALAPGCLAVAQHFGLPLSLLEIGASAGLNLCWDAFHLRFGATGAAWGDPAASVRLHPDWEGPPPPLVPVHIAGRAGCDRRPIDLDSAEARRTLRAYLWPDQPDRLDRLDAAIAVARRLRPTVAAADAVDWLSARLADRPAGQTAVICHSIVWQYLSASGQRDLSALIEAAGAEATPRAPLAWLRMEPGPRQWAAALTLTVWPGATTIDLADVDYHGRWLAWRGPTGHAR